MTTLMTWGNSEGIQGRCDPKCHNAVSPECRCMCGGAFHGRGRNGTLDQARKEYGEKIFAKAEEMAQAAGFTLKVTQDGAQLGLFQ